MPALKSPTAMLPPLARLHEYARAQIECALHDLEMLYFPGPAPALNTISLSLPKHALHPVHRLKRLDGPPDSGYASAEDDDENEDDTILDVVVSPRDDCADELDVDADMLRTDAYERSFAVKWLTGFISRSDTWSAAGGSDAASTEEECLETVDAACTLLARFSRNTESPEDEAPPHITRQFSFPRAPTDNEPPVTVELNDAPLSQTDHTSVGLQSWAASIILATRLCASPASASAFRARRVLELGAGTGLLSIAAAKLGAASVVATDYHADVLANLRRNVSAPANACATPIDVCALDWEAPGAFGGGGEFDVLLAADVIYDPLHAVWIKACVERFLRRSPESVFWLAIPVRETGRHGGLAGTVDAVFGVRREGGLVIRSRDEVGRIDGVGRADESGYRVFEVRWDVLI
ncbi:hypothetical protein PLICRDRAFT_381942 [Plicaturopsis crispa FD-325 SS-3]|nr:hypothetical protein PLICRDRAFT_381942 [Plicaturopsis crispa FD-325 SS-3]